MSPRLDESCRQPREPLSPQGSAAGCSRVCRASILRNRSGRCESQSTDTLGAVDAIPAGLLTEEQLTAALTAEAAYDRGWLPTEPYWPSLERSSDRIAGSILTRLRRGARWPVGDIVDVRKPGHGTRPVAVLSPEARIAYRALAALVIPEDAQQGRSAAAYADFVLQPIINAYPGDQGPRRIGSAIYTHVVVADLAAFYQYVDHNILLGELDLVGAPIEASDALAGLLLDIEGRGFGIPQMCDPSDWISEPYAARVERALLRDGFSCWRYSDDFRIGCRSYSEALGAIEALSRAARDVGLIISDRKTTVLRFLSYLFANSGVDVSDASNEIDPEDVEASVTAEYMPDDEVEARSSAERKLARLKETEIGDGDWDVRDLSTEQHREIRRALNTLTKFGDAAALSKVSDLLRFQPALTHRVVRYLEAVHRADGSIEFGEWFRWIVGNVPLNEWQAAWIAHGVSACDVQLSPDDALGEWLRRQLDGRRDSLASAEAAVAMASNDAIAAQEVAEVLRGSSANYSPWYLHALKLLADHGSANATSVDAVRRESVLAEAILGV